MLRECRCVWRAEECNGFPGAGVTDSVSHLTWMLGTKLRSSERAVDALNCCRLCHVEMPYVGSHPVGVTSASLLATAGLPVPGQGHEDYKC